jgi:hypothetical protein
MAHDDALQILRHFDFKVGAVPLPWVVMVAYDSCRVTLRDSVTSALRVEVLEGSPPKRIAPWVMREKMLNAKTDAEIIAFLNHVGGCAPSGESNFGACIRDIGHFHFAQNLITTMMLEPVGRWARLFTDSEDDALFYTVWNALSPINTSVELVDNQLAIAVNAATFLDVVFATIYIDKLRGVIYRRCKRRDCPRIFEVQSRHGQRYCQQYCAHLASMRRNREALRRAGKRRRRLVEQPELRAEHAPVTTKREGER